MAIGKFSIEDATRLDQLAELSGDELAAKIIAPVQMVSEFPTVELAADQIARVRAGQDQPLAQALDERAWVRLIDSCGALIAMAEVIASAAGLRLQPRILLAD
jgi:tRNA U55 pseudouridine synthase TruB